jgi:hypothetical protein
MMKKRRWEAESGRKKGRDGGRYQKDEMEEGRAAHPRRPMVPLLPFNGRGESGLDGSDCWLATDFDPSDLRGVGIDDMRRERDERETLDRAAREEVGSGVVERELAPSYSRSDWDWEVEVRW